MTQNFFLEFNKILARFDSLFGGENGMVRVLIADDSAFMRKIIADLFDRQSDFQTAGTAKDGKEAVELVKKLHPDVVTMDVNMPVMDGLKSLEMIMKECPTPVVMFSSLTKQGADATIKALSLGAIDFISKTGGSISKIDNLEDEILTKCKSASQARVQRMQTGSQKPLVYTPKKTAPVNRPPVMKRIELPKRAGLNFAVKNTPTITTQPTTAKPNPATSSAVSTGTGSASKKLVAIGTSTGGPQALQAVITRLPRNFPCGVVVVQHMPQGFTKSLAERLDTISAVSVKEAENDEIIKPGYVYIAPGGFHMRVKNAGNDWKITLSLDPPVGNHRPAVNVLFDSVANIGSNLVAVIMTGMGSDGCDGMKKIKNNGGYAISQNEATSTVYGMPKAVVDAGLADEVRPLNEIAEAIVGAVQR